MMDPSILSRARTRSVFSRTRIAILREIIFLDFSTPGFPVCTVPLKCSTLVTGHNHRKLFQCIEQSISTFSVLRILFSLIIWTVQKAASLDAGAPRKTKFIIKNVRQIVMARELRSSVIVISIFVIGPTARSEHQQSCPCL